MDLQRFLRALPLALIALAAALFQTNTAQAAACEPPPADLCAAAPAEQAEHCRTLANYLADFQQNVCSLDVADPTYTPHYAVELGRANGNLGTNLLAPWNAPNLVVELDHLVELGADTVRIDIVYPLLTPSFHAYLASNDSSYTTTAEDYIAFYRDVVAMIRARGLRVHIEHSNLLSAVSTFNPAPYYETMKAEGAEAARNRYRQERAEEAQRILTELAPDALTLINEPDTDNNSFGWVEGKALYTPEQWREYVEYAISRFPAHSTLLGAGAGSWDTDEYVKQLAALPTLDYIDIHIYPARGLFRNYLDNVLVWTDLVRKADPTKEITIGEAWLYKADAQEISSLSLNYVELLGRDVYSYWEPLDVAFIELLDQAARAKQISLITPFWTRNFYAYLDYESASQMGPLERMSATDVAAFTNMREGKLTRTGQTYRDLMHATNPLIIGNLSTNHGPQTGSAAMQTVVISGAGFVPGSDTTVLFGDTPSPAVQVIDSTTIYAVVPEGSGTVTVRVISPDGRSAAKPDAYRYDPPPTLTSINPSQGPEAGDTFVVLEGANFSIGDGPVQVFFGDVPASNVNVLGNQVTVRTPAGVGLGRVAVRVQNGDGQSAVLPDAFHFVPRPQLTGVSPAQGASSGGSVITLTGQHFAAGTPGTKVLFGPWEATNVTVIDTTTIQVTTPPGMGTVKLTIINPDLQTAELADAFTYVYAPMVVGVYPAEGIPTGGNEVWIMGARIQPGVQVFFGETQAAVQSVSENVVKVIAPTGSGQVPVRLVNPDGQRGQWEKSYRYSQNPAPAVLYFTPGAIPVTGQVRIYLYGQNFQRGATVHFGQTRAYNALVLDSSWIVVTAPAGSGHATIRVTNPDGKVGLGLMPMNYGNEDMAQSGQPGDLLGIGDELVLPQVPDDFDGPQGTGQTNSAQIYLPVLIH